MASIQLFAYTQQQAKALVQGYGIMKLLALPPLCHGTHYIMHASL